ncbi:hypothetical protein DIT71_16925 [Marinobacter vulgaris]|uniref:Glycosyl transferase n=1 Tax=Marinobacter vulgaris TaxID=1928331 RepID=A0A2V3ZUB2_9GAMM|nr:glycosyltransferase family 2 protein [Marinobacter vulgaris]PXX88874.1 hypothetical protein DIT71_16925 [Marinobacter vulgaris]TSJ66697.1 glycosyltransferase family 2 protein [Marinobacter vulgaris]
MKLLMSKVVHNWDESVLEPALRSLSLSLTTAAEAGELDSAILWLSYNGHQPLDEQRATELLDATFDWPVRLLAQQPNLGYGRTNNLALDQMFEEFGSSAQNIAILVINPDVVLEDSTITAAAQHLRKEPDCGLVCPLISDWQGRSDAIGHKRYPSFAVLTARLLYLLFKLPPVHSLNERYEYRDMPSEAPIDDIELCSGCFMLGPLRYWQELGGFDGRFFMYFEDFDLAVRGRKRGWRNHYVPAVKIRHAGGGVGTKNWRHRWWFIRSALRFFNRHGWRMWRV